MVLDIRIYGSEVLREKALPVEKIDEEVIKLLDDMVETMNDSKGVGLAAPQVGVNKRVFVLDVGDGVIRKVINPVLEYSKEIADCEEGCLSVPGIYKNVKRSEWVTVTYLNEKGVKVTEEAHELLGRAFQHETDHLDGILFVDKISPMAKRLISKKLQNLAKENRK
ncbi:MAG: peptide deformylase [Fusobacteriaceae bacterium]